MIWDELAMKSERMAAHSATAPMAELFEGQKHRLGECLKAFRLVDCQIGAAFAVNEGVASLECFGYQWVFGKFFTKLVQSYRPGCPGFGLMSQRKPRYPANLLGIS
jgi:hypothetical protein